MVSFIGGLFIGIGAAILLLPVIMYLINLFKDTIERRNIKKMIKKGEFLSPIDAKDFDQSTWQEIDVKKDEENLANLDKNIFKRI